MRDLAFALVMAALTPLAAFYPWIGVMGWTWLSLMAPQLMMFGFMYGQPVSMVIGLVTVLGLLFSKSPKRLPMAAPVMLLIAFSLWMCVTYLFSLVNSSDNLDQLNKVLKINIFTLVTILILHTRKQVDILIAVMVVAVGFFGVKGGIFTITTGGEFRVRGAGGFLHGNNEIGLGLVMVVPLMYYFVLIETRRWWRRLMLVGIGLTVVAAVGTQSRGALVAIGAMGTAFILRSPRPGRLVLPILVLGIFVAMFMPEQWWERMASISDYGTDESAQGRLNAWTLAYNVASHNLLGGGFTLEVPEVFNRYAPNPSFIAVAHSIYFQVLGHHGFIGLFLYLVFWVSVFFDCRWLAKNAQSPDDLALARMIEVSLVGFATGGAFLSLAYFDGPYYLMAALVVMRHKVIGPKKRRPLASNAAMRPKLPAGSLR